MKGFSRSGLWSPQDAVAFAGLTLAQSFHLLSCFMLYWLSWDICDAQSARGRSNFAFIAACIHIISPAGLFLAAPYAESVFSFFNFTGFYLYLRSCNELSNSGKFKSSLLVLASGLSFGIATIIRSNGLLSGLLFLFELTREASEVKHISDLTSKAFRLGALLCGGLLMAACAIVPQYVAYLTYCVNVDDLLRRQWCSRPIPSIYTWVQSYYW